MTRYARFIRWLNLVLLVVNLAAFATILFIIFFDGDETEQARDIRSLRFLREQLDLTDEQYHEVVQLSDRTFRRYNYTLDLLCDANISLLEELASQEPDEVQLDRMTRRIGTMHTNLKNLTVEYFQHVRSVCSEEQITLLASLFKEIMQLEKQCEQCNRVECPRQERLNQIGMPGVSVSGHLN